MASPLPTEVATRWNDVLALYALAMRAAGRSGGTINLHRHYLRNLAEQLPRGPWSASQGALVAFLAVEHWAPETRKSARAAVRGFYRWAHGAGYLSDDPAASLPSIRVPAGVPRPAPEHLVRQLTRREDRLGHMGALAAYVGLRAAEIARVHARDLVGDELLVHGKGGKVRAVPVDDALLLAWLRGLDGWAFPGRTKLGHMTPAHVTRLLSRAMPAGWTAHTLRHRMASQAYAGTRDLLAVGAVLGHSRPETTQRYVRMPDDALRDAVRAAGRAS